MGRTVLDAERAAKRFTQAGRGGIVLRFAAFYGSDGRFFADMIRAVRHGYAPLFGRPDALISCISHDDAAAAVVVALGLPAGLYNVVDDEPLTHREVVDALADALRVDPPRFLPSWLACLVPSPARNVARSQRLSNRKLTHASEWRPRFRSVREGFPRAVAPFLTARERMQHAAPTPHSPS